MKAEIERRESLEDKLYRFLMSNPMVWHSMKDLERVAGNAWRSRLPQVRRRILAETGGVVRWNKKNAGFSSYIYVPFQPLGRDASEHTQKSLFG